MSTLSRTKYSARFLNDEYSEYIELLLKSFVPQKGVPLQFGKSENYFASVTSTVLLTLHYLGVLSEQQYEDFYEALFFLRDDEAGGQKVPKNPEDAAAWDVQESASIWSTGTVLWAFLGTHYKGKRIGEVREALIWCLKQQHRDGGWGFDIQCRSDLFFTGMMLHVINLALKSKQLGLTDLERKELEVARRLGVQYVQTNFQIEGDVGYGKVRINEQDIPDPTATLFAMWALFDDDQTLNKPKIDAGLEYLRQNMEEGFWGFKTVVSETRLTTKYGVFKVVKSFSPAFVIFLLRVGCDPLDPLCLGPMKWFEENRTPEGWPVPGYRDGGTFVFATAYALWVRRNWNRQLIEKPVTNLSQHLKNTTLLPTQKLARSLKRSKQLIIVLGLVALVQFIVLIALNTPFIPVIIGIFTELLKIGSQLELILTILSIIGIVYALFRGLLTLIKRLGIYLKEP